LTPVIRYDEGEVFLFLKTEEISGPILRGHWAGKCWATWWLDAHGYKVSFKFYLGKNSDAGGGDLLATYVLDEFKELGPVEVVLGEST